VGVWRQINVKRPRMYMIICFITNVTLQVSRGKDGLFKRLSWVSG
jgi:hypothetical protein